MRSFVIRTGWPKETRYVSRMRPGAPVKWTTDPTKAATWKRKENALLMARTYLGMPHSPEAEVVELPCPDGGHCGRGCRDRLCARVGHSGPLSGVFPNDEWPMGIRIRFKP